MDAGASRPRRVAFAPSDCHTCLSATRKCQRERPYCSTCLSRGIRCGGYATELSWHSSRTFTSRGRRPSQQRTSRASTSTRQKHPATAASSVVLPEESVRCSRPRQNPVSGRQSPASTGEITFTPGTIAACFAGDFPGMVDGNFHDFAVNTQAADSSLVEAPDVDDRQGGSIQLGDEDVRSIASAISVTATTSTNSRECEQAFQLNGSANSFTHRVGNDGHSILNPLLDTVQISLSLNFGKNREKLLRCCKSQRLPTCHRD